ncbi:hypothetical protein HK405_001526, partial [Cladochytrium tenue]
MEPPTAAAAASAAGLVGLVAIPFLALAVARDLQVLDLLALSHTCTAARAAVAHHIVGPALLRPLLNLAHESAAMRHRELLRRSNWFGLPAGWVGVVVGTIRSCIDLRLHFNIKHLDDEVLAHLQTLLTTFKLDLAYKNAHTEIVKLLLNAVDSFGGSADVAAKSALEAVPFEDRFD